MKIIEVIGALLVMLILLPSLLGLWDMGVVEAQKRQAADHLVQVAKASAAYVRKHQATLLKQCTAAAGPTVDVPALVADKLLPAGFNDRNVWGQQYLVHMRQPQPNELQAVVLTTGGPAQPNSKFSAAIVPSAAMLAGGAAGYIPTGDVPGQSSANLHGAAGGWNISLAALGIPSPGPGHLGALATFDSSALGQDFLYRVAVPGHPQLNAMQTELDMTDHAIRHVSDIQFTPRAITTEACMTPEEQGRVFLDGLQGLYLCRNNKLEIIGDTGNSALLKETRLSKNGDRIAKPLCPPGSGTTARIFTSPTIAEAGPNAPALHAFQAWATSVSDTEWQVHLRLLTNDKTLSSDGWVYPIENYGRIMVMTLCAKSEATP